MARGDLTDQEWAIIGPLLPPERGLWARPAGDNRLFLNGMLLFCAQVVPGGICMSRYGKWNSVYVRLGRTGRVECPAANPSIPWSDR